MSIRKHLPLLSLCLCASAVSPPPAPAAEPPIQVEAMRVGLGQQPQAKVGTWTPVWVQLKAGPADFEGLLEVATADDAATPVSFRTPVRVPAGATQWVPAYGRPGGLLAEFVVRAYDARGRRRGAEASSASLPNVLGLATDQLVVATLGNPRGVDLVLKEPGFTGLPNGRTGPALIVDPLRVPDGLPGRWYGYDAAESVVVDTNDADAMDALNAGRGQALAEWVRRGGHLVVAVGASWQRAKDSVLGPLLPAEPAGRVRVDDLGGVEQFGGADPNKGLTRGRQSVEVTRLQGVEARGGRILAAAGDAPLIVRGAHGFGRVTLLGFDVDTAPFADWTERGKFWTRALDLRRRPGAEAESALPSGGGRAIIQTGETDLSTRLRSDLDAFPGVTLVPFGWVAFFIFVYILLIGPGDYFFLKKVVGRMEFTWITFPAIVVAVSLLAYAAAYAFKGTDLRVNKVDVVDLDVANDVIRGSSWFTVFSPQNRDYDVRLLPRRPDRAGPPTADPDEAAPAGGEVVLSWFGAPEAGFGGMNAPGRLGFGGGGYAYQPAGRVEWLEGVRVPIWSTRSFTARWFAPAGTALGAELEAITSDRLVGTITNTLQQPLRNAVLIFGGQVYYLNDQKPIPPGATVRLGADPNRTLSAYLGDQMNQPTGGRARALMFFGSLGARAESLGSDPLRYLDLSGQLALGRPMLVAELDGPGAALALGNAAAEPKVVQTTLLRALLPLGAPESDQ